LCVWATYCDQIDGGDRAARSCGRDGWYWELHLSLSACADPPSNGYKTSGSVRPRQRAFGSIVRFNRSRQMAAAGPCDPLTAQSLHDRDCAQWTARVDVNRTLWIAVRMS